MSFNPLFIRGKLQGQIRIAEVKDIFDLMFQSLIHQGKIARGQRKLTGRRTAVCKFQSLIHQGKIASEIDVCGWSHFIIEFQSLIHQGKIARTLQRFSVCIFRTAVFQSLIHQGKIASVAKARNLYKAAIDYLSFNPLFIRGKLQGRPGAAQRKTSKQTVSIPYSSGENCKNRSNAIPAGKESARFQSLIHQGKIASHPSKNWGQAQLEAASFNPLFIREKLQEKLKNQC